MPAVAADFNPNSTIFAKEATNQPLISIETY
jgi:hypothetical protein